MASTDFESLQTRYGNDPEFRGRLDSAASTEEAIHLVAEYGIDATASMIAQLSGSSVELDLDLLEQVSGGEYGVLNFTFN